jgi:uncharacterized protein YggE
MMRLGFGRVLRVLTVPVALAMAPPAAVGAEESAKPVIRVSGESTVHVKPDQAELNLGVVTQAASGQAAASQNAQKQDAVVGQLKKTLGAGAEIKTIGYSLSPNYRYPKEGGQPTISGYTASNTVQVKINDLSLVGKVIDAATQSGANTVDSLRFTLKDEKAAQTQALREAAGQARAKAEALAAALSVKIVRVLSVDESGQPPRPIYMESMKARVMDASAASTPVEAGTIDIQASVTVSFEISQ